MNLKDINWNQIYYFYEIARKQSLKKSAKVLGVSSATLSEHIKKLEKSLGFDLFHRNHKGLVLSKEGENLFQYAKDMFETGLKMVDSISPSSMGGYPVKVGVLDTISDLKSLQFISQYYDTYAPYGIVNTLREYNSDKLLDSLMQGQLDWIITTSKPKGKMIDYAEIDKFTIAFCCSKHLIERFKDKKDVFAAVPLALNNWDHKLNQNVIKHLQDHGVIVEENLETDHRELALMLAERGRCVTVVDREVIKEQGWLSNIAIFDVAKNPIEIPIYCAWKKATNKMIATQKLEQLIHMSTKPMEYDNPDLMIKIAEVPQEQLKERKKD